MLFICKIYTYVFTNNFKKVVDILLIKFTTIDILLHSNVNVHLVYERDLQSIPTSTRFT